jgi:beta-barrel assembly-enhancing protease
MRHTRCRPYVALVAGAVFAVATMGGCAKSEPEFEAGFNLFSTDEDVRIGRESAAKILQQIPIFENEEVEAYVRSVAEPLTPHAPGERFPYEFHVVNLTDVNAFALPGGIVFVTRGTLETVRDEGELAGVLAHEISHVALRHGTSQMSKAYVAERGLGILGTLFGGAERPNDAGEVATAVGGIGLNTLFLKFSRECETEADLAGARMLAASGYDPIEMSRFFDTIRGESGPRVPAFLLDHPDPGDRANAVAEFRKSLPISTTPRTISQGFWQMKSALRLQPAAPSLSAVRVGPEE